MDFFKEFERLKLKTPRVASVIINSVNSDYCHNCDNCKNCYLIANGVGNQDCMYGRDFYKNTDCIDCDHIETCTLCYNCVNCKECWNGNFLQDCANAVDCDYGYFLKDCKNCIGCAGLRKKEFHIFNKPYSKEEFFAKKASLTRPSRSEAKQIAHLHQNEITEAFNRLKKEVPRRDTMQINTENCFGCVSLHRKEYHFLNQPYSKDEYFKKTAEIKDQLKREGTYDLRMLTPTYPLEDTVALWPRL